MLKLRYIARAHKCRAKPEGTNNKIKTIKRQAYGFRDKEFLKLGILAIDESKYASVGRTKFLLLFQ